MTPAASHPYPPVVNEFGVGPAMPVIRHIMENAAHPAVDLTVPLQVDAHAAHNWDEAH